jgi:RNA-binding protein 23/39
MYSSRLESWSLFNSRKMTVAAVEAMDLSSSWTPSPLTPNGTQLTHACRFRDAGQAREALEKMNGFDLAGRPIRVGLGNDKFTPESTANLLQRFQGQNQQQFQGSAFSGAGGRGPPTSNFDRAGGRDNDKGSGASALDDTDVGGVNFNNYSRDALMRKLARTDEASNGQPERQILKPKTETKPLPVNVNMASRCVVLHNMFDPSE